MNTFLFLKVLNKIFSRCAFVNTRDEERERKTTTTTIHFRFIDNTDLVEYEFLRNEKAFIS